MLDRPEGNAIPGTEGALGPSFSPDGEWIAYQTSDVLKKVQATGGPSITLCEGMVPSGLSWGDDNTIVIGSDKGLMRVPSAGGKPEALTTADSRKGEIGHRWPHVLDGGRGVLFTIGPESGLQRIAVLDRAKGCYRVLVQGSNARYLPTGHLVYVRGAAMFAVPFDLKRLEITGAEVPVLDGLAFSFKGYSSYFYAVSDSGLLVPTGQCSGSRRFA
jgi:serine/threonine-protein kinase